MKILVIEDDLETRLHIMTGLKDAGHEAVGASDGEEGLAQAIQSSYHVIILDRMLPKLDGLSLLAQLRERQIQTPVLILSALGQVDERVKGLRAGGDDYLSKPFAFVELLARVEVMGQRALATTEPNSLQLADLHIDLIRRSVKRSGQNIELQPREFKLLEFLARNAGQVVTRSMLLEGVWDYHFDPMTNVIDVHISRLRQKIDRGFSPPLLHTVRGAGYRLGADEQ